MSSKKKKQEAQNPLILRCHRLMEAFAKSDDERDFYIDRKEGFLIYCDLDKPQPELTALEKEIHENSDRYCPIPKLTFYETKKIMEGFVNEKVYDIDTKEKLLDIIQSKEARDNFLEFIYDHHSELEKWQQYYQERSRIRIIEWLRLNHFHFVFEEDLDLPKQMIEKLKQSLFETRVSKEVLNARKALVTKAKMYYSNEALNPRPKRGRPPKQAAKQEIEPQVTIDIFTTVPPAVRPFLFTPELSSSSAFSIFSSKFESEEDYFTRRQTPENGEASLSQKLASLRALSAKWMDTQKPPEKKEEFLEEDFDEEEEEELEEIAPSKPLSKKAPEKKSPPPKPISKPVSRAKEAPKPKKLGVTRPAKLIKPSKLTQPTKSQKVEVKRIIPQVKKEKPRKMQPLKKIMPRKPK